MQDDAALSRFARLCPSSMALRYDPAQCSWCYFKDGTADGVVTKTGRRLCVFVRCLTKTHTHFASLTQVRRKPGRQ
jgi:hypothetical protein